MIFIEFGGRMLLFRKALIFIFILVLSTQNYMFASDKLIKSPVALGKKVMSNSKAMIDISNISQGYFMVKYTGSSKGKIKMIIQKNGGTAYTYDIVKKNQYETFPISEGNGNYKITVYENIGDTRYITAYGTSITVNLENDYIAFLYPNQFVNFKEESKVVELGAKVTKNQEHELDKVGAVYNYVVNNFSYDYQKAKTVQSGYIPDVDNLLNIKKGICLDYVSVMVSMLRSQGIPTKLVVGYAENAYHAWINVYTKDSGWIDNVIYFDGLNWNLMDPTFASTSANKTAYKPDEKIYSSKFVY